MKKTYLILILAIQLVTVGFAQQDTLHHYSDEQIMKLTDHIKLLEKKTAPYQMAHPNDVFVNRVANASAEKLILYNIVSDSLHSYNDVQIIKLARYIKHLEKLDSLNTVEQDAIAAAEKRKKDSLAAIPVQVAGVEKFQELIYFDFDSYTLKKESYKPLDEAVKELKKYSDVNFVIEGHTDNFGTDEYNLRLSKERAKTVMNYFISKGIPSSQISSEGYGESKPVQTNETEEGRAKNRRVEIKARKK